MAAPLTNTDTAPNQAVARIALLVPRPLLAVRAQRDDLDDQGEHEERDRVRHGLIDLVPQVHGDRSSPAPMPAHSLHLHRL
ncbi:hypothetical protein [Nocardia sp. NBC_01388]|uniref:hypothetical protein n=1 Tax=Nocardia sp. NBC_01388 TaxID=2903596 RepID=UPI00324465E4